MIKAILFDFGGVIYEHPKEVIPEVIARIYNQTVETAKKAYDPFKEDYYLGKILTEKLIASLSLFFKSKKSIKEIKSLWIKNYADLAKPNKAVLKIIKKLHKNYKLYLFSNTTEMSHLHNSKTGIYDNFDGLFMSFQTGMKKPDEKIYEEIMSKTGFKPDECIFIDDDPKNLKPAKLRGMRTVLFNVLTDPHLKLEEELRRLKVII